MARKTRRVEASELQGVKDFNVLDGVLKRLRNIGVERDKTGNRERFCDQHLSSLLLDFFYLVITSLKSLQQASELDKVQKLLGVKRVSMGRSARPAVFDPGPVQEIIQ